MVSCHAATIRALWHHVDDSVTVNFKAGGCLVDHDVTGELFILARLINRVVRK